MAANRDGWRKRVHAITMKNEVSVKMSGAGGKVVSNLLHKHPPRDKSTPKPETSEEKAGRQYRERDAHEAFFRPGGQRGKQQTVKRKQKPRPLTDKERAEAARAHWDKHHGDRAAPTTSATMSPPPPKTPTPAPASPPPAPMTTPIPPSQQPTDIWAAPAFIPAPSPPPPTTPQTVCSPLNALFSPVIHGHHQHYTNEDDYLQLSLSLTLDSPTITDKS